MADDIGQAVLEGIKALNARFDRVETRLSSIETGLSSVETNMSSFETRLASFEKRLSSFEIRMSTFEARITKIEEVVADMDLRMKTWPDLHFLASAANTQIARTREMKADINEIKVRLKEIYQSMATDPEINTLREDVSRFRKQSVDLEVRVGTLKGHLGLDTTLTPR